MSVERQLIMASGGKTQYTIANSLRFRSSASAYLNRTPASAGNRTTWTWSAWVKRGALGSEQMLFSVRNGISDSATLYWEFLSNDTFTISTNNTPTPQLITTQVFRDPSSWYHIVLAVDTTQATASNRIKLYVNGTQVTAFSTATYPSQNALLAVNQTFAHQINCFYNGSTYILFNDGYLTEINFVDGQALTPSSFGETSSTTGVWIPKKYTGSYGTNGFYLNFSNGTSTTTLGYDASGNSNNWTTNNISLTSGSTYDWMIDSPTSYAGTSYGVGNYCVLNPLVRLNTNTAATLSEGNLKIVGGGAWSPALGTIFYPSTGKWYYEATISGTAYTPRGSTTSYTYVGVSNSSNTSQYGLDNSSTLILGDAGYGANFASSVTDQYGAVIQSGAIIGVAIDRDANTFTFYVNNVSAYTGTINYTSGATLTPIVANYNGSYTTPYANFGQRPFAYTPPSGYKSLCTQNLPAPAIPAGDQHMNATTYTGTGSSLSVVNYGAMQPDFVWIKSRSAATDHALYDVIRGVQARLESNTTDAEVTSDNGLTAFGSSGFTVNTLAQVNTSSATYVGWQWKAGGTAVTNTAGSITSQVSANTTAGFSVVNFLGTGANATVGHGLGVALSFLIVKNRDNAGTSWVCWHSTFSGTQRIDLNATSAVYTDTTAWNSTTPTSTVFSVGTAGLNASGKNSIAYCFAPIAGYSAFGSYTGNGSSDGPFVFTNFRPRFVLVKRTDTAGNSWRILDSSRSPYNLANAALYPDVSIAEDTGGPQTDFLSNGFKVRSTSAGDNANGSTYIYAAFAENPLNVALAR